jgi:hypothetical protein
MKQHLTPWLVVLLLLLVGCSEAGQARPGAPGLSGTWLCIHPSKAKGQQWLITETDAIWGNNIVQDERRYDSVFFGRYLREDDRLTIFNNAFEDGRIERTITRLTHESLILQNEQQLSLMGIPLTYSKRMSFQRIIR